MIGEEKERAGGRRAEGNAPQKNTGSYNRERRQSPPTSCARVHIQLGVYRYYVIARYALIGHKSAINYRLRRRHFKNALNSSSGKEQVSRLLK